MFIGKCYKNVILGRNFYKSLIEAIYELAKPWKLTYKITIFRWKIVWKSLKNALTPKNVKTESCCK